MDTNKLKKLLEGFDEYQVDRYCNYCRVLSNESKNGQLKNPWMQKRSEIVLATFFKAVSKDGLEFDGKHITIQSTGVSYDYQAYKNKMFLQYPESVVDVQLVYTDDKFSFEKHSGKVVYQHEINNPFDEKKDENVIGGYCVIKNKRGEFLTLLSKGEIEKHRKVAKTDYIWNSWFIEMCMKTVIKKACKQHFNDIFQNIETLDNENYDLEKPLGISVEAKKEIEEIKTIDSLEKYYHENISKNAGIKKDFNKAISQRKKEIEDADKGTENQENGQVDSQQRPGDTG